MKIYGWCKLEDGKYMVKCGIHGVTEAYKHGYYDNLGCLKCLNEKLSEL